MQHRAKAALPQHKKAVSLVASSDDFFSTGTKHRSGVPKLTSKNGVAGECSRLWGVSSATSDMGVLIAWTGLQDCTEHTVPISQQAKGCCEEKDTLAEGFVSSMHVQSTPIFSNHLAKVSAGIVNCRKGAPPMLKRLCGGSSLLCRVKSRGRCAPAAASPPSR